ncbi:hypothetical protein [Brevundimonas sp. TWP2-3-2]|uniref:hypothetical protein n=1 Tax=unclassified Brevundimonas TaxID=2622653 RepID=UPI003CEED08D
MSWPIRAKEQEEADRFYGALGRCIAQWSELEFIAGGLFFRVTKLSRDQAKVIFHSGRNWRTKTEMLNAAISTAKLPPGLRDALTAIVDRSGYYASFRNAIAHDMLQLEPVWVARGGNRRELCLRPHVASLEPIYDEGALRRQQLENGAKNISLLSAVMIHALNRSPTDQLGAPERLRLLVSLLPAAAHHTPPDPSAEEQILLGIKPLHFPK